MLGQDLTLASALMNYVPSAVVVIDHDAIIRMWNRGAEELFAIPAVQAVGLDIRKIEQAGARDHLAAIVEDLLHGRAFEGEIESLRAGESLSLYYRGSPLTNAQGEIIGAITVAVDLTESRRSKDALRDSEDHLRQLRSDFRAAIEAGGDAFATVDENGRILDVNDAACAAFAYTREELLTMRIEQLDLGEPGARERHLEDLRHTGRQRFESRIRRKDGRIMDVEVSISASRHAANRLFAVIRDITERKRLEEQFRQAQKMEAIGRLAGGVAHDFNNLLTAIAGYSELVLRGLPQDDPRRHDIEEIKRAGERAATLTRQLLTLSRKQTLRSRAIDLNHTIADAEGMLRRVIGEDVKIVSELAPDLSPVKADPGQIEQVLLNLAVNARDAMPNGGRLRITTGMAELGPPRPQDHATIPAGRYVTLAVSDDGTGMDDETRSHLFEPFFTTKERGKGTGLGLATVYGIVQQSEGYIEVDSELGHGTTVRIYLTPLKTPVPRMTPESQTRPAPLLDKTILLVEDDAHVRDYAARVLREQGYNVVALGGGPEALAMVQGGSVRPDLLITDVVMPEMTGLNLADALRHKLPSLAVVYISGYADDAIAERGLTAERHQIIGKPFTPELLAQRVRELLTEGAARSRPSA